VSKKDPPSAVKRTSLDQPTLAPSDLTGDSTDFELAKAGETIDIPNQIGDYRIERLIGAGGMGRVYLALHGRMERTVALKTLSASRMGDEKSIERFYSEIRAAARLLHPNIVTAFDAGEVDGIHYLAMEYVEGRTLSAIVAERGPLSVVEAVDVLRQTAQGLLYAHRAAIVHRDIKPGNLMQAAGNVVKLLDLGLATMAADSRGKLESGRLIGTVEYMAPEQLDAADRADARADIYALGATFYFLLTGRTPYEGELLEQVRGHREGLVPDLCAVRQDVDVRLDHVLRRMMAKRPQDRYASLSELLEDLDHWRSSEGSWLAGYGSETAHAETPTNGGDTTSTASSDVIGIDLGMFYGCAAKANPTGELVALNAGGHGKPLLRLALASDKDQLVIGDRALDYRTRHPERVTHCLPLYIGQAIVQRRVAEECCPPEVLLALMLRRLSANAWTDKAPPRAAAITVPSCYDQIHRRSILQASQVAGMHEVRLIDRSIAAAQAVLMDRFTKDPRAITEVPRNQLVVCITGNTTEVVLLRRVGGRLQQLAIAGTWHTGMLSWQQKLVDLASEQCVRKYGFDPRRSLSDASELQVACERALNQLLLHASAPVQFVAGHKERELEVSRDALFAVGREWLDEFRAMLEHVRHDEPIGEEPIHECITVGLMAKMPPVRKILRQAVGADAQFLSLERTDLARGAAVAVAGELPGRSGIPLPPQFCTPHDLGVVVNGTKGTKKRVLPIVPKGTVLPARTNRKLTSGLEGKQPSTLNVVESIGWNATNWRSLGSHRLPRPQTAMPVEIGFEVDSNGLLSIRVRDPGTGHTDRLPPLPSPTLSRTDIAQWHDWLDGLDASRSGVFS